MSGSTVLKNAKILWMSHFAIALSPLFFTVFILELSKYENVREMLVGRFSEYQQVLLIIISFVIIFMSVLGYKLYKAINHFTSIGEDLTKEEIVDTASKLKFQLAKVLKVAGFGFMFTTAIYITGMSYLYVLAFALPSIITYLLCSKIYYLRLA